MSDFYFLTAETTKSQILIYLRLSTRQCEPAWMTDAIKGIHSLPSPSQGECCENKSRRQFFLQPFVFSLGLIVNMRMSWETKRAEASRRPQTHGLWSFFSSPYFSFPLLCFFFPSFFYFELSFSLTEQDNISAKACGKRRDLEIDEHALLGEALSFFSHFQIFPLFQNGTRSFPVAAPKCSAVRDKKQLPSTCF